VPHERQDDEHGCQHDPRPSDPHELVTQRAGSPARVVEVVQHRTDTEENGRELKGSIAGAHAR
jgi:hypothetical protein